MPRSADVPRRNPSCSTRKPLQAWPASGHAPHPPRTVSRITTHPNEPLTARAGDLPAVAVDRWSDQRSPRWAAHREPARVAAPAISAVSAGFSGTANET